MKLTRDIKKCRNCRTEFKTISFCLEFGGYGYLVGRNEAGNRFCMVELLNNDTYNEFCRLYAEETGDRSTMRAQHMFRLACDPVDGASVYFTEPERVCIKCGGDDLESVPSPEPAATVDSFEVTYTKWNSLDEGAKRALIRKAYEESKS